jgi:hypothetical protein
MAAKLTAAAAMVNATSTPTLAQADQYPSRRFNNNAKLVQGRRNAEP